MSSHTLTIDPERALPSAVYRDPAVLAAEMRGIWRGDWVLATTVDALASPGDQLPVVIGDQPVLLLRNQQGELAALSNLCAHRGTLLVDAPANAKRIQCPYHAWTYNDAGRLLSVPYAPKDAVDKAAHCLPSYRIESWHGLVFVSLNPDVEPLAERFSAVEPHVTSRGIDGLHHWSDYQETEVWDCNWKLAIVNAMESYHLFQVHSKTLEPHTPTKGAYYIAGSARATATGGTTKGTDDYLLISLPPGFVGVLTPGSLVWQSVHPMGTDCCAVRTGGAFASAPPARLRGPIARRIIKSVTDAAYPLPDFLHEDKAICERGQRGSIGDFTPGRLVPIERVVADFGHYLNWRLNDVEPPAVHTEVHP
ncbi:MAG: aromatic ring-hydroxylating dioxygenase subunit alpha [Acidimicrobiia bacterium]|nr:aromatic ring-hydroxylating dioxygenase subunit alpha [Acidimicrobiia bacterium]MYC45685.1 aromatic ring-hydroxylating dioxygenase subunit alpha [Acidimicrobiia bacterium]MYI19323.1 aromatic ring-hydroxylating dioxygenase subunit alpha [Acidimicrobiia bacterium]